MKLTSRKTAGRAFLYLVAAILVQQHQHQRHDDDDRDHDGGVQDGVHGSLAHRVRVLGERRVNPAEVEKSTGLIPRFHFSKQP